MKFLEDVQNFKADLQNKKAAKLLKENDELQNLRAELQNKYSTLLGFGEKMNWESLTEDLRMEILVRLPVKSLMRFKCVQRSWNILFKTPSFLSKRRLHSSENDKRYPKRRSLAKSKKSVAKMLHVAVIAEIQSGMKNVKCAYDLKTEACFFLEDVLTCKAELQKEL
ncbi:BSD domain protein [Medicago truncatula]|uniref:BSD domain protein n=1 Tax=Medicago truncatula TaxID=3880 RepID=G7KQH6_MEDTR|nr:BSD domain protein [Medicago truncatula]